ncbi:MAG: SdrD B-like domain-containing protein, partial [Leptothrix sp. (in: b-proteobacteria)]
MQPSAINCGAGPFYVGDKISCSVTCTNKGVSWATNPVCDFTGSLPPGAVKTSCGVLNTVNPELFGLLDPAQSMSNCLLDFTLTSAQVLTLNAGTGASNDIVGGTVQTAFNNATAKSLTIAARPTADMSVVIHGLPAVLAPGQKITGLGLICSNAAGGGTALAATCALAAPSVGTISNTVCAANDGSVAPGASINCSFDYAAPGVPGGRVEPVIAVNLSASTGASNDSNAANNSAAVAATIIDAVDDGDTKAGGQTRQSTILASNDRYPVNATFSLLAPTTTCPNVSVAGATGVATYDTPASGSCVLHYQVCAPSPLQSTCDDAVLSVTVLVADMSVALAGVPPVVRPGQALTGLTLTCRNATTGTAALAASCVPTVSTPGSAVRNVSCSPAASGTVPPGAAISCHFDYTVPGLQGGAAEPTLSVVFTGSTGASNDSNAANNSTSVTAAVLDAVDDGAVKVSANGGQVPLYGNDRLAGQALVPAQVTASLVSNGGLTNASIDAASGNLIVPAGSAPGSYALQYRLCAGAVPVAEPCDTATVTVMVDGAPDLVVRKSHSPATFTEGHEGTYTITASNQGYLATSGSYTVVDSLPAGLTVAAMPTGSGWDCSTTQIGSRTASCSNSSVIAAGNGSKVDQPAAITLKVLVASGACVSPDANGTCSVAAGQALVNLVAISGGGEPDTPAILGNNSYTDPTPIQQAGAVAGRAWLDLNTNHLLDADEPAQAGVTVEVLDASGKLAGSAVTDNTGAYRIDGLLPGSGYSVRFLDGGHTVYPDRPVSNDPSGGNDPSAVPGTGLVSNNLIQALTIPPGNRTRLNQSLPLVSITPPRLLVVKTGDRTVAELGDSVRYTVTIKRVDAGLTSAPLEVIDTLPAGFRYIDGTAQLGGVSVADPIGKPGPQLRFKLGSLATGGTAVLSYRVRLGVGAQ